MLSFQCVRFSYMVCLWCWMVINCINCVEACENEITEDDLTRKELTLVAAYANTEGSDNVIMKSTTTPSMLSCAYECLKDSDCKSILVEKAKQQMGDLSYKCHIIDGKTFYSSKTTSETFYFIAKKDALDFLGNTELDGANEMSSEIANND